MKKIIFLLGIMAIMASCGSKTTKPAEEAVVEESVAATVDSTEMAMPDSVEVAMPDTVVAE